MNLTSPSIFIGKQGKGCISLGSGQPDLPPPKEVIESIDIRKDLRYGLIQGELELRKELSKEYPESAPGDFIITNGASEALDLIFRSIGKGKVLLGRPYYYSYPHLIKNAGMTPVFTDMKEGQFVLSDLKKKIVGCKVILLNSPSNPTGRLESVNTLKEIEKITKKHGIYVISDEVYKDLIYERENYLLNGNQVITVNSFSKTYCMCGLRVGYLWSKDKKIVNRCIEIKTHSSMNTNLVGQDMALIATKTPKSYIEEQKKIWKERRDYIYKRLIDMGLDVWKPEGAFYVFPKVPNPRETVWELYKNHNLITYLGEWFGDNERIRLSYATDIKEIKKAMNIMQEYLKKYK